MKDLINNSIKDLQPDKQISFLFLPDNEDPDSYVNKNGNTALHLCIENNCLDAVKFLLFKGANQHITDKFGKDGCDRAKACGMAKIITQFNNCNQSMKINPKQIANDKKDSQIPPETNKNKTLVGDIKNIYGIKT